MLSICMLSMLDLVNFQLTLTAWQNEFPAQNIKYINKYNISIVV